nr:unnamed protein product [Spirometra erinaceieuropaei]
MNTVRIGMSEKTHDQLIARPFVVVGKVKESDKTGDQATGNTQDTEDVTLVSAAHSRPTFQLSFYLELISNLRLKVMTHYEEEDFTTADELMPLSGPVAHTICPSSGVRYRHSSIKLWMQGGLRSLVYP